MRNYDCVSWRVKECKDPIFRLRESLVNRSIPNQPEELAGGIEGHGGAFGRGVGGEWVVGRGPTAGVRRVRVLLQGKSSEGNGPGKGHIIARAENGKGGQ